MSLVASPHAVLEAARALAGVSHRELWIAYFGLGGFAQPEVLRLYLDGGAVASMEYDILAQAINEVFLERGQNHPVPYLEDLA